MHISAVETNNFLLVLMEKHDWVPNYGNMGDKFQIMSLSYSSFQDQKYVFFYKVIKVYRVQVHDKKQAES